jgi:hypothetical protein
MDKKDPGLILVQSARGALPANGPDKYPEKETPPGRTLREASFSAVTVGASKLSLSGKPAGACAAAKMTRKAARLWKK